MAIHTSQAYIKLHVIKKEMQGLGYTFIAVGYVKYIRMYLVEYG